jgi:hypothetical protein
MSLQNRVLPDGQIVTNPAHGMFMGNRGGRIHDPETRTLTNRRWASRQWIICVLDFKQRHREVMGHSYTELFFLDEVTALAAGHRPCFECRRYAALAFIAAHGKGLRAPNMDRLLHAERVIPDRNDTDPRACPDGTMFASGGSYYAKRVGLLLAWTPGGYSRAVPLDEVPRVRPLTPATTIGILTAGYTPVWHPSAANFEH